MTRFLNIPLTLKKSQYDGDSAFEMVNIETSVRQFLDFLVSTRQGECVHNPEFGYSLWSKKFEPILNLMEWQPIFMEQIKELIEKYEPRITAVQVWEPEITSIRRYSDSSRQVVKTDKNYKITIRLDYTIKHNGERQNDVKIVFEY
jgi:phage baseplate assembly protein W